MFRSTGMAANYELAKYLQTRAHYEGNESYVKGTVLYRSPKHKKNKNTHLEKLNLGMEENWAKMINEWAENLFHLLFVLRFILY